MKVLWIWGRGEGWFDIIDIWGIEEEMGEKMDFVIGGRFKFGRKIGSGFFGEFYLGKF